MVFLFTEEVFMDLSTEVSIHIVDFMVTHIMEGEDLPITEDIAEAMPQITGREVIETHTADPEAHTGVDQEMVTVDPEEITVVAEVIIAEDVFLRTIQEEPEHIDILETTPTTTLIPDQGQIITVAVPDQDQITTAVVPDPEVVALVLEVIQDQEAEAVHQGLEAVVAREVGVQVEEDQEAVVEEDNLKKQTTV